MSMRTFFKRITGNVLDYYPELRDAKTWDEHVAAGLRLELKCCPVCSGEFKNHRFASLASVRIGSGHPSADRFLGALKQHNWDEVMKCRTGEEKPDNAEAIVIDCPRSGLAILCAHTPFEPWDYASIDFCEVLKVGVRESIEKQVRENIWKPLEKRGVSPAA